jgi:diaminopimelate decarboxylase
MALAVLVLRTVAVAGLAAPLARPAVQSHAATRTFAPSMVAAVGTDERLRFLTETDAIAVKNGYGTPAYVYSEAALKEQAATALAFPHAYGLTVRFAMKACPNAAVLQTFDRMGLHIDASSGCEVRRAVAAGVAPSRISLSSQQTPEDLAELLGLGIKFNACSLKQLRAYGQVKPDPNPNPAP